MNYAKTQPDLAIMAVNTFVTDSQHPNPLIRGLAIRTMSCIRVQNIVEYLSEPLRNAIQDKNPYVRKTAAVAVAKLYDLDPSMAVDNGFIDMLEEMLSDQNPMVVANAVASLSEISSGSNQIQLTYTSKTIKTLLAALGECTEWGQIYILDSLATFEPKSIKEAEMIAERVIPRFQHANSGVVLSAIKIVLRMMSYIEDENILTLYRNKIHAPLITLINSEPEIQYVALRNISLVVQKYPQIFNNGDEKIFFCKYNDPIYVKIEKIETMIKLANERNISNLLLEFKEYATEIDVEYVRKAVRAIGRCAIKLESAAQECIDVLLGLIATKVNYVVQEAIIVIKDIFRKYPGKYERIIGTLCENLDTLDEPEAKASMIWILGQYAERIKNADELLEVFVDSFLDEPPVVQLQLLTAVVKLFLKRPEESASKLVTDVLTLSTERSDNPDLRDRGYVYGRLLTEDPEIAKKVVLSETPVITDESVSLSPGLLDELIGHISSLASVYHKPPEMFVPNYNKSSTEGGEEEQEGVVQEGDAAMYEAEAPVQQTGGNSLLDLDDFLGGGSNLAPSTQSAPTPSSFTPAPSAPTIQSNVFGGLDDILGFGESTQTQSQPQQPKKFVLKKSPIFNHLEKGDGVQIDGVLKNENGRMFYDLTVTNHTNTALTGFGFKFNKNTFALQPGKLQVDTIAAGQTLNTILPVRQFFEKNQDDKVDDIIQIAMRANNVVRYGADNLRVSGIFQENAKLDSEIFLGVWQSLDGLLGHESFKSVRLPSAQLDDIISYLASNNVFYVRDFVANDGARSLFFNASLLYKEEQVSLLLEITTRNGSNEGQLCTRSTSAALIPVLEKEIIHILQS